MPRNVRNFWLELDVDGQRTQVATGPVAKDGGFQLTIRQRDKGDIVRAMHVRGWVQKDGSLKCEASLDDSSVGTLGFVTER